jgi:hypothetical protein
MVRSLSGLAWLPVVAISCCSTGTCPKRLLIEARWGSKPLVNCNHGDSSSSQFGLTHHEIVELQGGRRRGAIVTLRCVRYDVQGLRRLVVEELGPGVKLLVPASMLSINQLIYVIASQQSGTSQTQRGVLGHPRHSDL